MKESPMAHGKMVTRCAKVLNMSMNPGTPDESPFVIAESCPAGHPVGTRSSALIDLCQVCPMVQQSSVLVDVSNNQQAPLSIPMPPQMGIPSEQPAEVQPPAPPPPPPALEAPVPVQPAPVDSALPPPPPPLPVAETQTMPTPPPPPLDLPPLVEVEEEEDAGVELKLPTLVGGAAAPTMRLEDIILPNGFSLSPNDESRIEVDRILMDRYADLIGPSKGGFSSHSTECFRTCQRKFWLSYVISKKSRVTARHFQLGSLLHCCLALRYGGRAEETFTPCDLVAQAGAPELAGEVRGLLMAAIQFHGAEELQTWCPRAVEYTVVWWVKVPIGRKAIVLPFTGKIDLVLGLKRPEDEHPGAGLYTNGVYIVDHKTSSRVTRDLIEGFGNDWQFKAYSKAFLEGGYEKVFGPLSGVMPNILSKGKKAGVDPVRRIMAPYPMVALDEFAKDELIPTMGDIYARLSDEKLFSDPQARMPTGEPAWARNTTQCVGRWGICDYFPICDSGRFDHIEFRDDMSAGMRLQNMLQPPRDVIERTLGRKEKKVDSGKDAVQDSVAAFYARYLLAVAQPGQPFEHMTPKNFVGPSGERKMAEVVKALGDYLKAAYAPMAEAKQAYAINAFLPYVPEGFDMEVSGLEELTFTKTGLRWNIAGKRGTTSWKMVAEWICENDWFSPDNVVQQ